MEITKNQFIVITLIVTISTVIVVTVIFNSNKNKLKNDTEVLNNNTQVQGIVENIDNNEKTDNIVDLESENQININNESTEMEDNFDDENDRIDIQNKSSVINNIEKQLEIDNLFDKMIEPTDIQIKDNMGIDINLADEYVIKFSENRFSAQMYAIIKPVKGQEEKIIEKMKAFLMDYENSWSYINDEQCNMVKEKKSIKRGDYLIYIVSNNMEEVLEIVRSNIK